MRRFFVEQIPSKGESLVIKGEEAGHISRVLRMKPGAHILLLDARGSRCVAAIELAGRHEVHVRINEPVAPPSPSPIELTLCQALLKARAMDWVIQKASELGAHEIIPFSSERTVVRVARDKHAAKTRRWREIAVNASKQSNRGRPMEVGSPCALAEVVERWQSQRALKLILWEDESTRDLRDLIRQTDPLEKVVGIVGPEGGFSAGEVEKARRKGFRSVSLGSRILRAETAALALVAILQYEWGDLS
jgi:16S rRNA (uracil1498-N3)-methyltransferase